MAQLRNKLHTYVDNLDEYGLRFIVALIEKLFAGGIAA